MFTQLIKNDDPLDFTLHTSEMPPSMMISTVCEKARRGSQHPLSGLRTILAVRSYTLSDACAQAGLFSTSSVIVIDVKPKLDPNVQSKAYLWAHLVAQRIHCSG